MKLCGHADTLAEASNLIDELHKRGEKRNQRRCGRNDRDHFYANYMELQSKLLEQITFNATSKIEEHMLNVMNESTHEENLLHSLQTNKKQFKIAVTFLTGYNGTFKVTSKNIS